MWNITSVMRDVEFHGGYCDDSNPSLKNTGVLLQRDSYSLVGIYRAFFLATILTTCVGNENDGTEDLSTEVHCDRVWVLLYWYGVGTKMHQGRYGD